MTGQLNNKTEKKKNGVKLGKASISHLMCVCLCVLSHVRLFAPPWTIVHQAPLSMEFPRQEHWSGLPFPTPVILPDSGIKSASLVSPVLAGRFFTTAPSE